MVRLRSSGPLLPRYASPSPARGLMPTLSKSPALSASGASPSSGKVMRFVLRTTTEPWRGPWWRVSRLPFLYPESVQDRTKTTRITASEIDNGMIISEVPSEYADETLPLLRLFVHSVVKSPADRRGRGLRASVCVTNADTKEWEKARAWSGETPLLLWPSL